MDREHSSGRGDGEMPSGPGRTSRLARRSWALLLALAVLASFAGLLTACSSDSSDDDATTAEATATAQQPETLEGARLRLATTEIELGDIAQDESVEYVLDLSNAGDEMLVIKDVESS